MKRLVQYLFDTLKECKEDKNSSDAYIQGKIDLIKDILKMLGYNAL